MMSYTSNFNTLLITREETSSSYKFSSCFSRKPMAFQQSLFLWLAAAVLLMLGKLFCFRYVAPAMWRSYQDKSQHFHGANESIMS